MTNKTTLIFFSAVTIAFTGCQSGSEKELGTLSEGIQPIDSFIIQSLNSSSRELFEFQLLNDSIVSFDNFDGLNFYVKKDGVFRYNSSCILAPRRSNPAFFTIGHNQEKNFLLAEKTIYSYDSQFHLVDSAKINGSTRNLKNDYFLGCSNFLPLLRFGDTLVSYYSHNNFDDFFKTYKEPAFIELILNKTIDSVKTYLDKPADLKYYDINMLSFHAGIDECVYKMYDAIDSIYCYNRFTGIASRKAIGNKDYLLPSRADMKKLFDPAYRAKRAFSSFVYSGLFHNPVTGNFVLFYHPPAQASEGKNPTSEDLVLKAIVLDKELRIIRYLTFKERFFPAMTFFQYGEKGLAMPIYNKDPTNEATKYYIYHF